MKKYYFTARVCVQGYVKYATLDGSIDAESKEEAIEKLNELGTNLYYDGYGDLQIVTDDCEVENVYDVLDISVDGEL